MSGNRPMVLDVITTLREMQKEDMAKQLENMVRSSYYREQAKGTPLVNTGPVEQTQMPASTAPSSQLVSAGPEQVSSGEDGGLGTSKMRVRLKGKMHMSNSPVSVKAVGQTASQPTSSVVPQATGIEKIRQLRATALGLPANSNDSSSVRKVKDLQYLRRTGGGSSTNISY